MILLRTRRLPHRNGHSVLPWKGKWLRIRSAHFTNVAILKQTSVASGESVGYDRIVFVSAQHSFFVGIRNAGLGGDQKRGSHLDCTCSQGEGGDDAATIHNASGSNH